MFLPDECRCRCPNVAEKEECERHASGKKWDPVFCRCFCPSSTFAICEENQVYDFRNECRYVLLNKLVHYYYIITLIHCVWKCLLNCLLSFCTTITNERMRHFLWFSNIVFSTVFNGSLGGNSFRCISRDKLWAEAGSGALKLSWEMAIIMVLSGLAFFLVTLAIVMAKKLSVLTKAGLHLPHRNSNASTAGSLSYTR